MKKQSSTGPRLFHPLSGCNLSTLLNVITKNGPIPAKHYPHIAIALLATLARFPFYSVEKLRVEQIKSKLPLMRTPIFIIGHWRGGTTHLYSVMSASEEFGFVPPLATGLPWDLLGIGSVFRPMLEKALPEDRFIDNVPVKPDSPQEDEIGLANMTPLSFYHGLYFPHRFQENFDRGIYFDGCTEKEIEDWKKILVYFLEKISIHQNHKQLLIKNPVYSARVKVLREIWPDAKFIHIHRNPYMVFPSMKNFYVKLFAELALQPYDHIDIDEVVLREYPKVMNRLLDETKDLPEGSFVELSFEEFEANPMPEMERIYRTLNMPGFEEAKPKFEAYLSTVQDYKKNEYGFPKEMTDKVQGRWSEFIDRWNYAPPGAPASA